MINRRGELSKAKIDRDWPHQVALPAERCSGHDYVTIRLFCDDLSLCPRGHWRPACRMSQIGGGDSPCPLHAKTPFELIDMSVKQPWDNNWKTQCRSRIRGCKAVIGIITNNTPRAAGQLWELTCAYEEKKPVFLMYGNNDRPANLPVPIRGRQINFVDVAEYAGFLNRI